MEKIDVAAEAAEAEERRVAALSEKGGRTNTRTNLVLNPGEETFEVSVPSIPEGTQAHVTVRVKVRMGDAPKKEEEE